MKKFLVLIGGYDLEMLAIKKILDKNNIDYVDKKLFWGAKLSDYKNEIIKNKDKTIVGIELYKDLEIDFDYIEIDHHNQNSNKDSSIEQISELFGITLNREERLIALNDKGYIPAMEKYGATREEIEKIRYMDREAQGVTKQDEELAVKSINENKKEYSNLLIVKSFTSKFSTITDRLYPTKNMLVYTDEEFTYYGEKAKEFGEHFQKIYGDKIYFGGSSQGFFGAGQGSLAKEEIEKIVSEVVEYVEK